MCFVDFRKAFDSINHESLWTTMAEMGFPGHIIDLISKLYKKQRARVRVVGTVSGEFRVRRGVRQGCVLSPNLFNILAERVMREALEEYEGGVHIGGRRMTNLRYADDIVLLTSSEEELQTMVERLDRSGRKYGLQINREKTKVMTTTDTVCQVRINQEHLEQVDTYTYLGSVMAGDGDCGSEIRTRLAKGYAVATGLQKIWKSHDITTETKIKLWRALVWPVALYGCESWTLRKEEERRIEAFEMKCLRLIMRVSWIEKRTNEWVMEAAGVQRNLLKTVKERKMIYFGHIMRKKGTCIEKEIIQGSISGGRGRGRPRMSWLDNIKSWTGLEMREMLRLTEDRKRWRNIVHDAAEPRDEDG